MAGRDADWAGEGTAGPGWAAWFAWGWVLLAVLAAAAELLDLERLRMALDLTRVF